MEKINEKIDYYQEKSEDFLNLRGYDSEDFNVNIFENILDLSKNDIKQYYEKGEINKLIKNIDIKIKEIVYSINNSYNDFLNGLGLNNNEIELLKNSELDHESFNNLEIDAKSKIKLLESIIKSKNYIDVLNKLELIENGYIFELEKYLKDEIGDDNIKKEKLKKLKIIDEKMNYKYINSNPEKVEKTIIYLKFYIDKNIDELSPKEKEFIINYYNNIIEKNNLTNEYIKSKIGEIDDFNINSGLYSKEISRKQFIELLENYIDFIGLNYIVEVDKNASNVKIKNTTKNEKEKYNNAEGILILPGNKEFENFKLGDVFRLLVHEIGKHGSSQKNSLKSLGFLINYPGYKELEEGSAKIYEQLLRFDNGEKLCGLNDPRIYAGEILEGKDFKNFLHIMTKLDGKAKGTKQRFNRYKLFYPQNGKGVFHEDMVYGIGNGLIKERLKELKGEKSIIPFISLSFIRVNYKNLWKSEEYIKQTLLKNDIDINDNKAIIEYFVGEGYIMKLFYEDLMVYVNDEKNENTKIIKTNFIQYLKEKYNFLPNDIWDIEVKDLSFKMKRNLLKILN